MQGFEIQRVFRKQKQLNDLHHDYLNLRRHVLCKIAHKGHREPENLRTCSFYLYLIPQRQRRPTGSSEVDATLHRSGLWPHWHSCDYD
jgi:hypothetical protein